MDGDSQCFAVNIPNNKRGANTTTYRNYAASFSKDNGVTWSAAPIPMEGTGCARPKLKRLPGSGSSIGRAGAGRDVAGGVDGGAGPMLLTGGRLCVENKTGIYLWVNSDGMGGYNPTEHGGNVSIASLPSATWERHSITAQHNRPVNPENYVCDDCFC